MIREVSPENDEEVDFPGFMELMAKKIKEGELDEELVEAFKTFDKGGKGYFTIDDLKDVMTHYKETLSNEDLQLMFEETDADGDG